MTLFASTSILSILSGSGVVVVDTSTEDFTGSTAQWEWNTPGSDQPGTAWTALTGSAGSIGSTGALGGANPVTRAVEAGNPRAYTEASNVAGPWTIESPEFLASQGTATLTFDIHMRFGSEGNIADGTLQVQGWNGSAWSEVGPSIVGSQNTGDSTGGSAYTPSSTFGTYTSAGFSNDDFKFRLRFSKGAGAAPNYDVSLDNAVIVGPRAEAPPPGSLSRSSFFNTGLRRLHVSKNGAPPLDGTIVPGNLSFSTIQAAVNASQAGDVVTIGDGLYFETISQNNSGGNQNNPIWFAAENPGAVFLTNALAAARAGTQFWRNDGSGVFSISGSRAFLGFDLDSGDFIPGYRSVSDINAGSINTSFGPNVTNATTAKPQYGMSEGGGRLSLKLKGGVDPNGRRLVLSDGFSSTLWTVNNSPFTIIDGVVFEAAGDGFSATVSSNSPNCVFTNCKFEGCQFGVLCANDTLLDNCEYVQTGMTEWQKDLVAIHGRGTSAIFRWGKNHYVGDLVGSNTSNSLVEGGIDSANFSGPLASRVIINRCWIHDCFEGSKLGRHFAPRMRECLVEDVFDDGVELETSTNASFSVSGSAQVYDNRFRNVHVAISHQGDVLHSDHFVYRNVMEVTDEDLTRCPFFIKSLKTPATVDVHYYHNTFKNIASGSSDGFGTNHWVWFGFGAPNGDADKIVSWRGNAVIMPNDLDAASTNPSGRNSNAVVSPSNSSQSQVVQGTGGTFFSSEASLNLDADLVPQAGSGLFGAGPGGSLPGNLVDESSVTSDYGDAGAFPEGFDPGPDWPRPSSPDPRDDEPPRWTRPGGDPPDPSEGGGGGEGSANSVLFQDNDLVLFQDGEGVEFQ